MNDLYRYFSRKELLKGREVEHPLTPEMERNLERLLKAITPIREAFGKPMLVSSCYRPAALNAAVGGSKRSAHMSCEAIDFVDTDGAIDAWMMENLHLLIEHGLYLESPQHTPGWSHVQVRPTRNRIFIP